MANVLKCVTPVDGSAPVSLSALAGRAVVINFWSTWCVPCLQEHAVPFLRAQTAGGDENL